MRGFFTEHVSFYSFIVLYLSTLILLLYFHNSELYLRTRTLFINITNQNKQTVFYSDCFHFICMFCSQQNQILRICFPVNDLVLLDTTTGIVVVLRRSKAAL